MKKEEQLIEAMVAIVEGRLERSVTRWLFQDIADAAQLLRFPQLERIARRVNGEAP